MMYGILCVVAMKCVEGQMDSVGPQGILLCFVKNS